MKGREEVRSGVGMEIESEGQNRLEGRERESGAPKAKPGGCKVMEGTDSQWALGHWSDRGSV
jgi:hypothetical protein